MKRFFLLNLLALLFLAGSNAAYAARSHHLPTFHPRGHNQNQTGTQPAQTQDIREVKNNFFSITLPAGWKLQKPVRPAADRVNAVFMKGNAVVVQVNIFKMPFEKKMIAEKILSAMRKRGIEVSDPVEEGDFYVAEVQKNGVKGKGWVGSNGSTAATTFVYAPKLEEANELLKALEPAIAGIIPDKAD